MLRTAQRSATRPSGDTAVELLDRTGIIAASLPQRRRTGDDLPELEPIYTRPPVCDQDLRPKSVVIRRRARTWLGSGAAVLLVAAGWLGGGMLSGGLFGSPPADDAAQLDARPAVAEAPAAPQPQPPQAPAATPPPTTVYVAVPAKPAPKNVQAQAKPQAKKKVAEEDVPRVDLPPSPAPAPTSDPVQAWVNVAENMMQQYQYRSETTSGR